MISENEANELSAIVNQIPWILQVLNKTDCAKQIAIFLGSLKSELARQGFAPDDAVKIVVAICAKATK